MSFGQLVERGRAAVRSDDMPTLRTVIGEMFRARLSIGGDDGMFDATNVLLG